MNKEQVLKDIQASQLSAETKQKIEAVLASAEDVSIDVMAQVTDLIQKEIDADFKALNISLDENDPEVKAALDEFNTGVAQVEKDLADDMKFVEEKLKDMDALKTQLSGYMDEADIADLKASLQPAE